jgi:hypothetical protein
MLKTIVRALWSVLYRLSALFALAYVAWFYSRGLGEVVQAFTWTPDRAWQAFACVAAAMYLAYRAGRESRDRAIRNLLKALRESRGQYRWMIDMNKTMIDDLLRAQNEGFECKSFGKVAGMSFNEQAVNTPS